MRPTIPSARKVYLESFVEDGWYPDENPVYRPLFDALWKTDAHRDEWARLGVFTPTHAQAILETLGYATFGALSQWPHLALWSCYQNGYSSEMIRHKLSLGILGGRHYFSKDINLEHPFLQPCSAPEPASTKNVRGEVIAKELPWRDHTYLPGVQVLLENTGVYSSTLYYKVGSSYWRQEIQREKSCIEFVRIKDDYARRKFNRILDKSPSWRHFFTETWTPIREGFVRTYPDLYDIPSPFNWERGGPHWVQIQPNWAKKESA